MENKESKRYFQKDYQGVMYTGSIGVYSRLVHILMEYPFKNYKGERILEVGANSGQHLRYVKSNYKEYIESDGNKEVLSKEKINDLRLKRMVINATNLKKFEDSTFDRVIATCLLAHIPNYEIALNEWRRVVKNNGLIVIYIPCEPGLLLRLVRFIFVAPKGRKYGHNHYDVIYRDHVNHYPGMKSSIEHIFKNDKIKCKRFPFKKLPWDTNLFEIVYIKVKK
jgi:ubiquinone/menaquinone biosynthesis C-methylase UbiE